MNKEEYLKLVRKEIKYVFDRDRIEKELSEHLQDSILDLIQDGYSYEDAQKQAIVQMGDPIEIGKLLNKEHHPLFGYLYSLTEILICLMTIPLILHVLLFAYNVSGMIFPTTTDDYVEKIKLDYEIDMEGHKVLLDYICINEHGDYSLTYRLWTKYSYSRSNWSVNINSIKDSEGNFIDNSGRSSSSGIIGRSGYIEFELPKNEIIAIEMPDNQVVTIDLGEYRND